MLFPLLNLLLLFSVIVPVLARPSLHRRAAIFHGDSCGSHRERAEKAFKAFPEIAHYALTLVYNYKLYHQGQRNDLDPVYTEGVEGGLKALLGITDFSQDNKDLEGYLDHLQCMCELLHYRPSTQLTDSVVHRCLYPDVSLQGFHRFGL